MNHAAAEKIKSADYAAIACDVGRTSLTCSCVPREAHARRRYIYPLVLIIRLLILLRVWQHRAKSIQQLRFRAITDAQDTLHGPEGTKFDTNLQATSLIDEV